MRRLLMAAIAAMVVAVVGMVPAQADHGFGHIFIHWPDSPSIAFAVSGEFDNLLGPQALDNAYDSMQHAANTWRLGTDFNTIAGFGGPSGNIGFKQAWNNANGDISPTGAFCDNRESQGDVSSVNYETLNFLEPNNSDVLGATVFCDFNVNGLIDHAYIAINSDYGPGYNNDWHFDWTTTPESNEFDFEGLFLHEFGHAIGWQVHLQETCSATPSGWGTMCKGHYGVLGTGTINSTLHNMDETVTNNEY